MRQMWTHGCGYIINNEYKALYLRVGHITTSYEEKCTYAKTNNLSQNYSLTVIQHTSIDTTLHHPTHKQKANAGGWNFTSHKVVLL